MTYPLELALRKHTTCIDRHCRLYRQSVKIRYHCGKRYFRLMGIETMPLFRSQGLASEALDLLCSLADDFDLPITLGVSALSHEGLTNEQLYEWYSRHGFVGTFSNEMIRHAVSSTCIHKDN